MGAALGLKQAQFDELDAVRGWRHRKYRGALTPQVAELRRPSTGRSAFPSARELARHEPRAVVKE